MIEEPLKYSKDVKTDIRRIDGVIFIPEHGLNPDGEVRCIINYVFQEVGETMHVIEASVYCAYPNLVRNLVDPATLIVMVGSEIQSMEKNIHIEFKTVKIL